MSRSRRPLLRSAIVVVVIAAIAGAAVLGFTLFVRGAPPPAVGLGSASPGQGSQPVATSGAAGSGGTSTAPAGGLSGTWTIDPSIGSFADFSSSFVGYRVNETLAGNRANTAVGRTPNVTGALVLEGTTITSVEIAADMTTLESDDDRRDGRLREQAIETGRFPESTFRLTGPIDLGSLPADGATVSATATGELTLHGITRTIEMPVQAALSGDVVTVTGSIDIAFADYQIQQPTSFAVLSIEDHGIMELQLHFRRG
jgi:polyisoprenoid-binding protein YceI